MSMSEAKVYIERYFARYPKVKDYMEQTKDFAHKHGYVTTIEGRKIAVANINSSNVLLLKELSAQLLTHLCREVLPMWLKMPW